MEDAAGGGFDRAREGVGAESMRYDFAFRAILLCSEWEGHESGGVEIGIRACEGIDRTAVDM
jgi:hypothetical protein